jgi:Magnesium transporter NIPA
MSRWTVSRANQLDAMQVVIPTQFVLFTLSAILGSAILYGDFRTAKFHQFVTFLYGCTATFAGVWIIASEAVADPLTEAINADGAINVMETETHGLVVADGVPAVGVGRILGPRRSTVSLVGISPAQVRSDRISFLFRSNALDIGLSACCWYIRPPGLTLSLGLNMGLGKRKTVSASEKGLREALESDVR